MKLNEEQAERHRPFGSALAAMAALGQIDIPVAVVDKVSLNDRLEEIDTLIWALIDDVETIKAGGVL